MPRMGNKFIKSKSTFRNIHNR